MSWIYACQQYVTPAANDWLEPLNKIMSSVSMQVAAADYQNPSDIQSFASWCSIHGVSFSGYTNQSEGSKLFQESRFS